MRGWAQGGCAHWRLMANTGERLGAAAEWVWDGDAACSQITFGYLVAVSGRRSRIYTETVIPSHIKL